MNSINDALSTLDTNEGLPQDDLLDIPERFKRTPGDKPAVADKPQGGSSSKRRAKPARKRAAPAKPAAKTKVKAARECPKSLKPRKGERSGQFIQRMILENKLNGITDKAFANHLLKLYPAQKTTHKDVAWNRWKLRKDGKLAKL